MDDWLLGVRLAYDEFRTDQASLWLNDLDLDPEFADIVQSHGEFFNAAKRRAGLKRLFAKDDTEGAICMKMLAVCAAAELRPENVLENPLAEPAEKRDEKSKLIRRCELEGHLWEQLRRCYGYESEAPSIKDFVIDLFKSCFASGTDGAMHLTEDALAFLKRWKDSRQYEISFNMAYPEESL